MCSSVETTGHTFVDVAENGSQCSGAYVSAAGERRQWQECSGCGNVQTRPAPRVSPVTGGTYVDGAALAIVDHVMFRIAFDAARMADTQIGESTSTFDVERDYRPDPDYVFRVSLDGLSGYCVRPDGELVYVFSRVRGRGADLLTSATTRDGATHLDCFDGYLTEFYARHGFRVTRREANWTPGGPDVVYMARCTCSTGRPIRRHRTTCPLV